MKYRYTLGEDVEEEIRRIIEERFERSIEEFQNDEQDLNKANHQMRKNMKKARGALRLVRKSMGENEYKQWNIAARDTARKGAGLRESFVALQTLDSLKERFSWKFDQHFYQVIRRKLETEYRATRLKLVDEENFNEELIDRLEDIKSDIHEISLKKEGFDAFEKGLKKVYKRGRKAKKQALKKPSAENFHEWRKRVKYLWYQIRILKDIWPEGLKGYANELHNLSDLLGDDHDLYDLEQRLHQIYEDSEYTEHLAKTDALIEKFSEELRLKAWPLGEKLYAEKPKVFVSRIESYWKTAHRELEEIQ